MLLFLDNYQSKVPIQPPIIDRDPITTHGLPAIPEIIYKTRISMDFTYFERCSKPLGDDKPPVTVGHITYHEGKYN